MAGADAALLADLDARAARRLDQASLSVVMIPAFRCGGDLPGASTTLLDVPLMLRLMRGAPPPWAGADAALLADLDARAARRLDQASLSVLRLVRGFLDEGGKAGVGDAAAACRVARLTRPDPVICDGL
uniref:NPH3 domain-containing protein n=1 Tax=Oryza barthii TaxID=65489 RepID=A0A0D3EPS6_9ORYZ